MLLYFIEQILLEELRYSPPKVQNLTRTYKSFTVKANHKDLVVREFLQYRQPDGKLVCVWGLMGIFEYPHGEKTFQK